MSVYFVFNLGHTPFYRHIADSFNLICLSRFAEQNRESHLPTAALLRSLQWVRMFVLNMHLILAMTKTLLNYAESLLFLISKSLCCFENLKNTLKVRVYKRTEVLSFHEFLQRNREEHTTIYIAVILQEFRVIGLMK